MRQPLYSQKISRHIVYKIRAIDEHVRNAKQLNGWKNPWMYDSHLTITRINFNFLWNFGCSCFYYCYQLTFMRTWKKQDDISTVRNTRDSVWSGKPIYDEEWRWISIGVGSLDHSPWCRVVHAASSVFICFSWSTIPKNCSCVANLLLFLPLLHPSYNRRKKCTWAPNNSLYISFIQCLCRFCFNLISKAFVGNERLFISLAVFSIHYFSDSVVY